MPGFVSTRVLCTGALAGWAVVMSNHLPARGQEYSTIKSDEVVQFFPTAGSSNDEGTTWNVPIQGRIFEPEENDALRAILLRELREELGQLAELEQQALLEERLRLFLVDNERNKRVGIRIADQEFVLPPSAPDGYFSGMITLTGSDVERHRQNGSLRCSAVLRPGDTRDFTGQVYCLAPQGVSVISDIDDTIKISDVRNKRELLLNSLAREYRAVDGMAAVFQKWADAGAAFHYFTASPWQLYQPLDEFIRSAGFPAGTFQMKRVRLKDKSIRELFAAPLDYKVAAIGSVMERFPQRTFILVGDSGEQDPEVFAALLRLRPEQISRILVRDVTNEPANSRRYGILLRDVPREKWQVFSDPATVAWPDATHARQSDGRSPGDSR
jgi:phosphatidate phosphatase APP1